jgi:MarR family transcriptional regulator for hemolysin
MLQYDFEQSVGYWVFSTAHEIYRAMNEELAAHGITYRQWEVLAWISYGGEQSQSALAECMRIEPPTLVGVLDRMERDGWIERAPVEGDRRKKQIRATPKVAPLWTKMVACAHRVRARAVGDLAPEQVDALRATLEALRSNLVESRTPGALVDSSPSPEHAADG